MDDANKIKLDIGCGIAKRPGYIGIDMDKNSDADIVSSALDLPFTSNSVDEIYSSHLIEHFSFDECDKFIAEVFRVLKKGGSASLKIDNDWSRKLLLKKDPTHKHRYSVKEIKSIIARYAFSVGKVKRKIYLFDKIKLRNKIFVNLRK